MKLEKDQSGFTIVELLIASVVFSMVLLVCSVAIVHIGRVYYKGIILNRTQDSARKLADDISKSIQFSDGSVDLPPDMSINTLSLCIGDTRYTYFNDDTDKRPQGSPGHRRIMVRTVKANSNEPCRNGGGQTVEPNLNSQNLPEGAVSMLGDNMRLIDFNISPPANGYYSATVSVSYGDRDDLFETGTPEDFTVCKGVNSSGQFCATSKFVTSVKGRL